MEFGLRELLAVVGAGLIGYVAWDGWRKRARNNYKFKLERNLPPDMPERPDREGFNQDGVSRPRLRGMADYAPDDDFDGPSENSEHQNGRQAARYEHVEPTFGESLTPARTVADSNDTQRASQRGVTPDLFGESGLAESIHQPRRSDVRHERMPVRKAEPDVIALMVLAREGQIFRGSDLVSCLLEHDLRFGEMDIFHRHADASGQGSVLFSVANALKPGTFDPNSMDNFSSPGVSLFMQLPGPQEPRAAYNLMLATAEQIALAMGGDVRDASRKPLSTEVRLRHQEILAEHERQLFAGA